MSNEKATWAIDHPPVTQSGQTNGGHKMNMFFVKGDLGRWALVVVIVYQALEILGRLVVP